jgi:hypothetical protein
MMAQVPSCVLPLIAKARFPEYRNYPVYFLVRAIFALFYKRGKSGFV